MTGWPANVWPRSYDLHADAVDDETVRFELDGETHNLSVVVAEQPFRDLGAAIETLRSDQGEDADDGDIDYGPADGSSMSSPASMGSADGREATRAAVRLVGKIDELSSLSGSNQLKLKSVR